MSSPAAMTAPPGPNGTDALAVLLANRDVGRIRHLEHFPPADGATVPWPTWVPGSVAVPFARRGIVRPWLHQAQAANLARGGRHVILATRAASGKSLAYLAPALTAVTEGGTALYIAPTKALAADQLAAIKALAVPRVKAAAVDGDATAAERSWARENANFLLTNPDALHHALLPGHRAWHAFFGKLRLVIVDECHGYRGVFGSHVAHVLRRLRRVARNHGREPTFVLASATLAEPAQTARNLIGVEAVPVTEDSSPRGPVTFALLDPKPSAGAAATRLLADFVAAGVPTLAFARSRQQAETIARGAREHLDGKADQVAAYRSGYLADDRRAIEASFRDGTLTGLAATTALELGVSLPGLDAVVITGWPGSWASLWQQAGRAGRAGRPATAVFIARDDPLDRYLIQHPDMLLRHPVESTVLDPGNPHVLAPHLQAAAAELPLTAPDLDMFGPTAGATAAGLARAGRLRERAAGWYGATRTRATALRGTGPDAIRVIEGSTGRLIGTMDEPSAHLLAHDGAVYLHQGETYLVTSLDLEAGVALAEPGDPGYTTSANQVTQIEVIEPLRQLCWGDARVTFGDVLVSRQVVSFNPGRSAPRPLDLPRRTLRTRATWFSIPNGRGDLVSVPASLAGGAHAAEHAALAMLPLFAGCDRWDVSGTSGAPHPATGEVSVFVYDGTDGGAGFAERGFAVAKEWLAATRDAIAGCECEAGCPCCVHSARCGSGNAPLSKPGAIALIDALRRN
jgi:DEAD/DEAH box helicase domain-containing protein